MSYLERIAEERLYRFNIHSVDISPENTFERLGPFIWPLREVPAGFRHAIIRSFDIHRWNIEPNLRFAFFMSVGIIASEQNPKVMLWVEDASERLDPGLSRCAHRIIPTNFSNR